MSIRPASASLLRNTLAALLLAALPSIANAKVVNSARDPYAGALSLDVNTGTILFEKNADVPVYPASTVKLMDLLIILERIEAGQLSLTNTVKTTRSITKIGGTQVWLKEGEVFTVEELLYAMMLRSANDAAAALAAHIAGTPDGFVELMNRRAQELGMNSTHFHSVHGLPPSTGQEPDVTTARDMATLARELCRHKETFTYTATKTRNFRPELAAGKGRVEMINHNKLLWSVDGCDGLKTGFTSAGGFSLLATAKRNDRRVIVAVMGTRSKSTARDEEAKKLLAQAFLNLPPLPPPKPVVTNVAVVTPPSKQHGDWSMSWSRIGLIIAIAVAVVWIIAAIATRNSRPDNY